MPYDELKECFFTLRDNTIYSTPVYGVSSTISSLVGIHFSTRLVRCGDITHTRYNTHVITLKPYQSNTLEIMIYLENSKDSRLNP